MSRKPPDNIYPYGYGRLSWNWYIFFLLMKYVSGKYETMGSIAVSAFLLAGGAGIGLHSFDLLLAALNASSGVQETVMATTTTTAAENIPSSLLGDGHHHRQAILDPNAAWFALASVVIKEWLYRASMSIHHQALSVMGLIYDLLVSAQGGKERAKRCSCCECLVNVW